MPTTKDRAEYLRDYYEKNKGRISGQKKRRYQHDPAYRDSIVAGAEKRRADKADTLRRKKEGDVVTYPMQVRLNDGSRALVEMLTVRSASKVIGVSAVTLKKWIDDQVLPPQKFKNARGAILFTQDQVKVIHRVYRRFYSPNVRWRIEPSFVKALWEELTMLNNGVDMI